MTATTCAQHPGQYAAEDRISGDACEVSGRSHELEPERRLSTGRQGGSLPRRTE